MKKIPTLFERNPLDMSSVLEQVDPLCQWVLDGEGAATRKYDGTCMMLDANNNWQARREVKNGKEFPKKFVPIERDLATGNTQGWVPISQEGFLNPLMEALGITGQPEDFRTALDEATDAGGWQPGTYELIGPKINGNPEEYPLHALIKHSEAEVVEISNLTFEGLQDFFLQTLEPESWEGIVWHHPDGRMAKLKVRDFK